MKRSITLCLCIFIFFSFLIMSCARPLSWVVATSAVGPFSYGPPTNVDFLLSSYGPGDDSKFTLTFDIKKGDLETHEAVIKYPDQFTFNGFLALGSAGTQIGSYAVDFDFDGTTDFTIPVFSIDDNTAYADRDINNSFDNSVDSTMVYSNTGGNHILTTTLPFGGDGFSGTITGPFTERIVAAMYSGIFTNPANSGTYTISATFTSVDPDTDGADDAAGEPPLILDTSQSIVIASKGDPVPVIKANAQDGSVTVSSGTPVSISISLDPGNLSGQDADWWLVKIGPDGNFYYFDLNTGSMLQGLVPTYQGALFGLGTTQLLNSSNLTAGTHIFYFAADMNMNGSLDTSSLYYSSVNVSVTQ